MSYMPFMSGTSVSGTSDYFDPTEFDLKTKKYIWQVTADGIPTEDGQNIKYEGCDESYKSANGTQQVSVLDLIVIALQFDLTLGFEFQTLLDSQ